MTAETVREWQKARSGTGTRALHVDAHNRTHPSAHPPTIRSPGPSSSNFLDYEKAGVFWVIGCCDLEGWVDQETARSRGHGLKHFRGRHDEAALETKWQSSLQSRVRGGERRIRSQVQLCNCCSKRISAMTDTKDDDVKKLLDKAEELKVTSDRLLEQGRKLKEEADRLIVESKKVLRSRPQLP